MYCAGFGTSISVDVATFAIPACDFQLLEPDGNSTDLEELDSEGVPAEPLSRWSKVKNSAGNAKTFVMDADNLPIVLGVSVGAVVLIWLMCVVCYKLRANKRSKAAADTENVERNTMLGANSTVAPRSDASVDEASSHLQVGSGQSLAEGSV